MSIEKIKDLHARLGGLLADPQPGLMTWMTMLSDVLTELGRFDGKGGGTKPKFEVFNGNPKTTCHWCGLPRDAHNGPRPVALGRCTGFAPRMSDDAAQAVRHALRDLLWLVERGKFPTWTTENDKAYEAAKAAYALAEGGGEWIES